ncbi:MAG: class B sortase [Christensenellales bacterium]|jgi:sortase B
MRVFQLILKAANAALSLMVAAALCAAGLYAGYALWDNGRVYAAAEDVQAQMLGLKPQAEAGKISFEQCLAINPDVCGWITLEGTRVDYPILQGETNLTYINTDVYGQFALAGSIYLDSRNRKDFSDRYALLYGHHMDNGGMFGDLARYQDEAFFEEHASGTLLTPDGAYRLEIFACLLCSASDAYLFDPEPWRTQIDDLLPYVQRRAACLRAETLAQLRGHEGSRILALSTCSSAFTDARTVVLAAVLPDYTLDQEGR